MSAVFNKSSQMDRALGIPYIGIANVFMAAISLLIHREMFDTPRGVVITGKYAYAVAKHTADKFGMPFASVEDSSDAAIHYSENLDVPCNEYIQVKLGVRQNPDIEYFYRFFDRVCEEALNEVLCGVTSQYLLKVAEAIQAPPSDSDPAVCCAQAY